MPFTIEKERDSLYIDGLQTGFERGEEKGIEKGREQGLEKGLKKVKETEKETKIAIAKAMLKQNMDLEMIVKLTGLSKKEVHKLTTII